MANRQVIEQIGSAMIPLQDLADKLRSGEFELRRRSDGEVIQFAQEIDSAVTEIYLSLSEIAGDTTYG